jgi:uncharacterized membrane protein required for colicin V production
MMSGLILPQFNWVDVFALILFIRMGYMGLKLGLGEELVKLTALAAGLMAGLRYGSWAGAWLAPKSFLTVEWASAVSLAVILALCYWGVRKLLSLAVRLVSVSFQEPLGRWGGLAAGLARAGLVVSLVLIGLQRLPSPYLGAAIQERSLSGSSLTRLAPAVYGTLAPFFKRLGLDLRGG